MRNLVCMECGDYLTLNANACACGWRKYPGVLTKQIDYRCAYMQDDGKPCHAPGRISRTCTANGAWYCADHWNCY